MICPPSSDASAAPPSRFGAIDKHFSPAAVEEKWYRRWEASGYFSARPRPGKENYSILLPPPNVTGTLHMGHAFQHTLMDCLIRRERMRGKNVLWQAGTDHAGIATQIVVTRQLSESGIDPANLSREQFLQHAWRWKENSGDAISRQMRRIGVSCDWTRECFTMDERRSTIVRDVFVKLYEQGLIYRGKRLVNWDPVLLTAVSDLEVVGEVEKGTMFYVRYPFVDDEKNGVIIGTTRPETILVDGAIAVHPTDKRFLHLLGKRVWVPMTEPPRTIEIIADAHVESDFGSGCVKITAAHDFNDYEVYLRHRDKNIPLIILFTPDAKMNDNAPPKYRGLDRYEARKRIVQDLRGAGLLIKEESHQYKLPRGDRSGAVVEPMLTDQWFVKMSELAKIGLAAADNGAVKFIPANWRKVYEQWLHNIQDWCISRQLMWGHQIPAWFDDDGKVFVAQNEEEARRQAGGKALRRADDVLDTWFSSALWPLSTLGWDKDDDYFKAYFPTSVLVTGFDIIFFWVARMVMMSGHLVGESPFRHVYITGLVRDGEGQKMSKSKGNILDPLDLIDGITLQELLGKRAEGLMNPRRAAAIEKTTRRQFPNGIGAHGADALRFTFASLASYGRDIKFDLERCAGYRNFCNKLWNAARFVLGACEDYRPPQIHKNINGGEKNSGEKNDSGKPSAPDGWIISRLERAKTTLEDAFLHYRFDLAANAVYHFLWNEYCDWYLEIAKTQLAENRRPTQRVLLTVLEESLRLAHPFIPFITEELWQKIAPRINCNPPPSIMVAAYPKPDATKINVAAETEMSSLMEVVTACRQLRAQMGVPPAARPTLLVGGDDSLPTKLTATLGKFSAVEFAKKISAPSIVVGRRTLAIKWQADKAAVRAGVDKKLQQAEKELHSLQTALNNPRFIERAPAQLVASKRARLNELLKLKEECESRLRDERPPPIKPVADIASVAKFNGR